VYTVIQKVDVSFQLNRAENVSNHVRMLENGDFPGNLEAD